MISNIIFNFMCKKKFYILVFHKAQCVISSVILYINTSKFYHLDFKFFISNILMHQILLCIWKHYKYRYVHLDSFKNWKLVNCVQVHKWYQNNLLKDTLHFISLDCTKTNIRDVNQKLKKVDQIFDLCRYQ